MDHTEPALTNTYIEQGLLARGLQRRIQELLDLSRHCRLLLLVRRRRGRRWGQEGPTHIHRASGFPKPALDRGHRFGLEGLGGNEERSVAGFHRSGDTMSGILKQQTRLKTNSKT